MRIILSIIAAASLAGCYAETGGGVEVAGPTVAVEADTVPLGYVEPEVVEVQPGVQVVYNYDYPVFFHDDFYWRYDAGTWYRSHYYTGGWAVESNVPYAVRSIDHPHTYAHYRPNGYVSRRAERRREYRRAERRDERRVEHRQERRQEHRREERKVERHEEHRQERKTEHREEKHDRKKDHH
jgi:hypothetical protein